MTRYLDGGTLQQVETANTTEEHEGQIGLWEVASRSDLLLYAETAEAFDWTGHVNSFYWLLRGKKQVWFDYLALLEYGLNGAHLEGMLNRHGIQVYGKMVSGTIDDETLPAFVLVDKSRERQVRRFFAKLGILL